MTISEKLTTIKNSLTAIKNSIIAKGQTPTGDITTYAEAIDNIKSGGADFVGIPRVVDSNGAYGFPTDKFTFALPDNVTSIRADALRYSFSNCSSLVSVDLSNIKTIENNGMIRCFSYSSLVSVDLSNLITVNNGGLSECFQGCSSLTSVVGLSKIETIRYSGMSSCFSGCYKLTSSSFSFDKLTNIGGQGLYYCFYRCRKLKELSFPSLTSNSFGSYTDQFNNMLDSVTGCTVHFPSNLESVIGSWSSVTSGFGGTNTTVLFDLPATE